jgi:hypothetical protein
MADEGPVMFPVSWSPAKLAKLSENVAELQAEIDASIGTKANQVVKFHWEKGRFTVTFADGQTYTVMTDV